GARGGKDIGFWREYKATIGPWDARAHGLGGWSLDVLHAYDPSGRALYLGTGERLQMDALNLVMTTGAGNGNTPSGQRRDGPGRSRTAGRRRPHSTPSQSWPRRTAASISPSGRESAESRRTA